MPELYSSDKSQRFLERYAQEVSRPHIFCPTHQSPKITTTYPHHFIHPRTEAVANLIANRGRSRSETGIAFLAERLTQIGLNSVLEEMQMTADLAPWELERSDETRKGIDVIVSSVDINTGRRVPLLGINAKLQQIKPIQKSEAHFYDPTLQCPCIHLSLGNWAVNTREQSAMRVRDWIHTLAVPSVTSHGHLPYFPHFRRYLFIKIERTLGYYLFKTNDFMRGHYTPAEHETRLFPSAQSELQLLYEKLLFMQSTFADIAGSV